MRARVNISPVAIGKVARDGWARFRIPKWELEPLSSSSRRYRVAWAIVMTLSMSACAVFILNGLTMGSTAFLLLGCTVGLIGGMVGVYNPNDSTTFSLDAAVSAALVFSGHPLAGVLCVIFNQIGSELRRPLVLHLRAINVMQQALAALACNYVFRAVADGAAIGSAKWALAAGLGMIATELVALAIALGFDIPSRLLTTRESFAMWSESARLVMTVSLCVGLMDAALINTWFGPVALFFPVLLQHAVYSNAERAMRAMSESLRDPLTKLGNRRHFDAEISRFTAVNSDRSAYGLFLDLDNFKRLNDTRGHDEGDRALVLAASAIRMNVRHEDLACRVGGEEFVVIMQGLSSDEAVAIAERIRFAIEEDLRELDVTVSIGAALFDPNNSIAEFMRRGDEAMYDAKRAGKNRVTADFAPPTAIGA